ncbi:MAG: hypothetical protein IKN54_09420 [Lachnospiraceae bacterium]|nr:hypothetical protein [Lachnospiraceae bacterium]
MRYYILKYTSGQPFILFMDNTNQKNPSFYLYWIQNGRIHSKGQVFSDYFSDFAVYECNDDLTYISYISTDNHLKIFKTGNNKFNEIKNIDLDVLTAKITGYRIITTYDSLILVYITDESNNHFNLYAEKITNESLSSTPSGILENILNYKSMEVISGKSGHTIILNCDKTYIWELYNNLTVKACSVYDSQSQVKISNLQQRLHYVEAELDNYKNVQANIKKQYDDLAEYAYKLQNELRKYSIIPH